MIFVFYDKFIELCAQKGITPNKAANEIGFDRTSISKWKKSGFTPQSKTLVKIAKYFDVNVQSLISSGEITSEETAEKAKAVHLNTIKIAGRDGSYEERSLTDEQLELFKKMIAALPEATDL